MNQIVKYFYDQLKGYHRNNSQNARVTNLSRHVLVYTAIKVVELIDLSFRKT